MLQVKHCYYKGCSATNNNMKRCSGCKIAKYCNLECQKKDWKNHKKICKSLVLKHYCDNFKNSCKENPLDFVRRIKCEFVKKKCTQKMRVYWIEMLRKIVEQEKDEKNRVKMCCENNFWGKLDFFTLFEKHLTHLNQDCGNFSERQNLLKNATLISATLLILEWVKFCVYNIPETEGGVIEREQIGKKYICEKSNIFDVIKDIFICKNEKVVRAICINIIMICNLGKIERGKLLKEENLFFPVLLKYLRDLKNEKYYSKDMETAESSGFLYFNHLILILVKEKDLEKITKRIFKIIVEFGFIKNCIRKSHYSNPFLFYNPILAIESIMKFLRNDYLMNYNEESKIFIKLVDCKMFCELCETFKNIQSKNVKLIEHIGEILHIILSTQCCFNRIQKEYKTCIKFVEKYLVGSEIMDIKMRGEILLMKFALMDEKKKIECRSCNYLGCDTIKKSMKVCQNCKIAHYCCVECQKSDWSNHKEQCKIHKKTGDLKIKKTQRVMNETLFNEFMKKNFRKILISLQERNMDINKSVVVINFTGQIPTIFYVSESKAWLLLGTIFGELKDLIRKREKLLDTRSGSFLLYHGFWYNTGGFGLHEF